MLDITSRVLLVLDHNRLYDVYVASNKMEVIDYCNAIMAIDLSMHSASFYQTFTLTTTTFGILFNIIYDDHEFETIKNI